MYLKQEKKKDGRIYLSYAKGVRKKGKKNSTTVHVNSIGYLDELEKEFPDPIAHFKAEAKRLTEEQKDTHKEVTVKRKLDEKLPLNEPGRKNLGYAVIMFFIYKLGIPTFLRNLKRKSKCEFNTSSIMDLLIISRILNPCSKKKTYEDRNRYFERFKFDEIHVYRALSHFAKYKDEIKQFIYKKVSEIYGYDMSTSYYDITNYYFEINEEDDLRKNGYSKENRRTPLVQMGLTLDRKGLPVTYDIFPGNESEKLQLRGTVKSLKDNYDAKKVLIVADSAQNTGDNIYYLDQAGQGYIFSKPVRNTNENLEEFILDPTGYVGDKEGFKIKSRFYPADIWVHVWKDGEYKKVKKTAHQKQVAIYSEKYAIRDRAKRDKMLIKAQELIADPSRYETVKDKGARRYVAETAEDKSKKKKDDELYLDKEKIMEDEKWDGYYCVVTNQFDMSDSEILSRYHDLWKIEESFKITKSDLETRPIHLSRADRIEAHFLICFISLLILRLLQKTFEKNRFSINSIIRTLNNISCSPDDENLYLFDYRTDVSDKIGKTFGIDFTRKRMELSEIKKILATVKKA